MNRSNGISTMRLYGAAIGIVSGAYSGYLATTGASMSIGAWFMLGLGLVVSAHGIVLLTPVSARLGSASGPLMLLYAGLMLLNQLRMALGTGSNASGMDGVSGMGGMEGGMGTASTGMTLGVGVDVGMIAIAVLMLASGLIMTSRAGMMEQNE